MESSRYGAALCTTTKPTSVVPYDPVPRILNAGLATVPGVEVILGPCVAGMDLVEGEQIKVSVSHVCSISDKASRSQLD